MNRRVVRPVEKTMSRRFIVLADAALLATGLIMVVTGLVALLSHF
jgi:uncharacterized membrane-anchored protein